MAAAEMLVGPAKVFFMDEISTGLDTSTTFRITRMLQQTAHLMDYTIVVSLLQPPPEIYAIFDDLILLVDRQIVYQGPCSSVLEFMAFMGFKCPDRKATADFLQEVRRDLLVVLCGWTNFFRVQTFVIYSLMATNAIIDSLK